MGKRLERARQPYGKKLKLLHTWNGWITAVLALTGLLLAIGFWRAVLGEGRVWLKWFHTAVGIVSVIPIFYYFLLAGKHWKLLKRKPWQRVNVMVVLALLLGWLISGIFLWQYRAAGPRIANLALTAHDLLTWIGLPLILYHSITRARWLRDLSRRSVKTEPEEKDMVYTPEPVYTRREFIRGAIGAVMAIVFAPSFLQWLNEAGNVDSSEAMARIFDNDKNMLLPPPSPSADSVLPIGGGAKGHFRVYTVTAIPSFTNENWLFTVDGLVEKPLRWTWVQFVELERSVQVSDFHCVTGWSVYSNTWEGIPLKRLLALAGVKTEARTVKLYSADGVYTDELNLEQAMMDDVMVALLHDGRPIPSDLGGPARLIVPRMYAYKSVKWLHRIELIPGEHIGYWEERGYPKDAWVSNP